MYYTAACKKTGLILLSYVVLFQTSFLCILKKSTTWELGYLFIYLFFDSDFRCAFGTNYILISKIQHFPVTKIISSRPWIVEPKVKPTTAQKRKTVSTTTTTTTAAAAKTATVASQPETTREVTEWRTTLQHEVTATTTVGKVENVAKELEWPFGGGGVTWVEVEGEEKQVKGSAVVEEVEVTEPYTIFEEIFDFDK